MTDECIHGLEAGLCDICYPKPRPAETPRAAPRAKPRESRPPGQPRSSGSGSAGPRSTSLRSTPILKPLDISRQRVFHLTHIDNLASILADGVIRADAVPVVDISAADTREARRAAVVGDTPVASFVPFFLVAGATVWNDLRADVIDPRLAAGARGHEPAEFVLLVTTLAELGDVVISDGDAAAPATRFAQDVDQCQRMLRRLLPDEDATASAEVLVPVEVPFERVTLIGVAHDKARDAVRQELREASFSPRVAVHPPWFARPE